jgi:hypothetical protein
MRSRPPIYGLLATIAFSLSSPQSPSYAFRPNASDQKIEQTADAEKLHYTPGETWVYRDRRKIEREERVVYRGIKKFQGNNRMEFQRTETSVPLREELSYFRTDTGDLISEGNVVLENGRKIFETTEDGPPALMVDRPLYVGKKWKMFQIQQPVNDIQRIEFEVKSKTEIVTPAGTFDSYEITPSINSIPLIGLESYWSERLGYYVRLNNIDLKTGMIFESVLIEHTIPKNKDVSPAEKKDSAP